MDLERLRKIANDETRDPTDEVYRYLEELPDVHWTEITLVASQVFEAMAELPFEDGSNLDAATSLLTTWAFRSGVGAVAKVLGLDRDLVEAACAYSLDDEPPEPGTEGLELLQQRIDENREWVERYRQRIAQAITLRQSPSRSPE